MGAVTETGSIDQAKLAEAQALAEAFEASLLPSFEIGMLTLKSKIPFKVLSYREALLHRFSDTAGGAVDAIEANRPVSTALLTRGSLETLARMKELHDQIGRFLDRPNVEQLDKFIMNRSFGWKKDPDEFEAANILNQIDKMSDTIPNFRSVYDNLSEYCHPNYMGVLGTFAEIDRENFVVDFTKPERRNRAMNSSLSSLIGSFGLFQHFYDQTAELMYGLNDHFEQQGE